MKFFIDSDLHCLETGPIRKKDILQYVYEANPDVIILAGDLTESGSNGDWELYFEGKFPRFKKQGNELLGLQKYVVKPLEEKFEHVLLCGGNHDEYFHGIRAKIMSWLEQCSKHLTPATHNWATHNWATHTPATHTRATHTPYPVINYIKKRHGSDIYIKKITKNEETLVFVCLGKYPDARANEFIKNEFPKYTQHKMVLFWHYNNETGHKWWNPEDKKAFIETIEPFRDSILCMAVGHQHKSYVRLWHRYTVINASGKDAYLCENKHNFLTMKKINTQEKIFG